MENIVENNLESEILDIFLYHNKILNLKINNKKLQGEDLNELKDNVFLYTNEYYNNNNSMVSDEIYDDLKEYYLFCTNSNEIEFDFVPGEASDELTKYNHSEPILSLAKINNKEDLTSELKRLMPCVLELKYDGLTIVVYPDSKNESYIAVTRANGLVGEVVTDKIKALNILNEKMISKFKYPIRFEAYITRSKLDELNDEREDEGKPLFQNTRNAASGILRNKDISNIKGISLVAYNLVGANDELSESEQLNYLRKAKIPVPDIKTFLKVNSEEDISKALEFVDRIENNRELLDYDIDGIVIKANYRGSLSNLGGCTLHHPKNAVAYKFKAIGKWTTLKNVIWSTGRVGKITPIGIFEPVNILGSKINKATLHNIKYIKDLNISIGDQIKVKKANDVIPVICDCKPSEIVQAKQILLPNECPECGSSKLELKGDLLYCINPYCTGKLINKIVHYADKDSLNIEGLAITTVQKMYLAGYIKRPTDIFELTIEQINRLDGFAKRSATKLYNKIQNARKNVSLEKFIYACGIPNVGRNTSKILASYFGSFSELVIDINLGGKTIASLKDIGLITAKSIIQNKIELASLFKYINPLDCEITYVENEDKKHKKNNFVFTGTLTYPREWYKKILSYLDDEVGFSNKVTADTVFLVKGDKPGANKLKEANKRGILTITEDEFIKAYDKLAENLDIDDRIELKKCLLKYYDTINVPKSSIKEPFNFQKAIICAQTVIPYSYD